MINSNSARALVCDEIQREIDSCDGERAESLIRLRKEILNLGFIYNESFSFSAEDFTSPLTLWATIRKNNRVVVEVLAKLNSKVKEIEGSLESNRRVMENLRKLQYKAVELRDFQAEIEDVEDKIKDLRETIKCHLQK